MGEMVKQKDLTIPDKEEDMKAKINSGDIEKESDFPGGQFGWISYLNSNLHYPERAENIHKEGEVITQFVVDEQGKVHSAEIVQSVEYSLDQEALRIINESPNWIPGTINGKKVKSYKKQPIAFTFPIN
jgi:protein TonB